MDLLVCWMCVLFSVPLTGCLEMHLSETLQPGTLVANMSLGPGWTYTMDRTFSSKSIQSLLRVDGNDGAIRLSRKVECAHTLRNPASVYFRTGSSTSGDIILTHFDVFVHGEDCFIKYKRRKESGKPDIHIRQLREMKLTSCLPAGNLLFNLTELLPGFTRSSTFLNSMCAGKELSALIMHGGLFPVSDFCLEHRRQRELGLHCALQSSAGERLSVQLSLTLLKVPQQVGSLSETPQRKSDILFLRAKRQVNSYPQFQLPNYQVSVPENEPAGTRVITLKATDADDGEAGRLEYSMEALFDRRSNDFFSIDSQTGSIRTIQSLDREVKDSYILKITVTDNGSPKKSAFSYLILTVSDTNDHSPVFEKYEYRVSIRENKKPVGSTVVVIRATDEDTGENARITYVMEDNVPQFKIDPDTGAITTQIEIDYEDQASYTLAIIARDNGIPQKSDTTYVEIIILDANDNAPQFLRDMYQGTVFEDAPVYTSILQISASDRDSGLNGRVSYTFQGGDDGGGDFVIHTHSGIIRTARKLDRENVPVYNLKAFAVDRGVPPLKAAVPIHVFVQDINDNAPVFEKDELFIDVEENSPVGSVVARISAIDPDEGTNAQIMYQIVEGNIPEVFQLDIFNGDLTALTDLDYETKTEYLIVVQATSAPLVSWATVHIRLVDMNDNRPVLENFEIIFNNYVTNKSNSFPSGIIGKVPAHDPDVSDKLRYKFESGNELSLLLLNEDTGDLRLSRDPENDRPLEAPIIISVTDGLHQVVARCTLRVTTFTGDMAVSQYSSP